MSKIQDVPFITKVIDTLSDELKSGLYDLIDGQVKTPVFRSLVNNDYAITEANDKGKVQFVTLETLRGNYTGYLAYNSVYCVLIAFKGNTQALDMLNINVAKHTFAFVNESLSILELRVELEDGKEGVTPTDLGVTNNNIHLAKGTTQIGEGVNLKTLGGKTLIGSGNVGFKTINDQEIVGSGNIVVGEGGTITIDETPSTTSENALMNKTITNTFATKTDLNNLETRVDDVEDNKANVDGNYPTMTVGDADNANNLIATKGLTVNDDPMSFGVVGGAQKSAVGDGNASLNKLVCVDVVKNQLVHNLTSGVLPSETTTKNGITFEVSTHFIRAHGTCNEDFVQDIIHANLSGKGRVLFYYGVKSVSGKYRIGNFNDGSSIVFDDVGVILNEQSETCFFGIQVYSGVTIDITFTFKAFSLTQRYGSNDVVNAIIGTDASTQVARLLAFDPEILNDTDYDEGTLVPSKTAKLLSVGVNQWDEEFDTNFFINGSTGVKGPGGYCGNKNLIKVLPNTQYCITVGGVFTSTVFVFVYGYDLQGNYVGFTFSSQVVNGYCLFTIPDNVYNIYFAINQTYYGTTYNHDICINISNPTINGKYYSSKRNPVTLPNYEGHGILKVVDGKVVADGDELYPDGNSKKRYGKYTFTGSESWNWYADDNYWYHSSGTINSANGENKVISSNGIVLRVANNSILRAYVSDNPTISSSTNMNAVFSNGVVIQYELATEEDITTPVFQSTFPVEQGGTLQFLDENDNPIAGLQGNEIFYQKNIKAFVEAFGEAINWNPDRIERLAKLSITPEYVNISLNPSQANAYAVAQVYNATFTIVISTALTGTPNGEITFQDSEIDLSSFETQPAESIYDMDGKKVSEEPITTDCNIASFVGRSYNGIVLWSLLHSGVNKVKVHFEQSIPLDSEGNGKLDCRASLIL